MDPHRRRRGSELGSERRRKWRASRVDRPSVDTSGARLHPWLGHRTGRLNARDERGAGRGSVAGQLPGLARWQRARRPQGPHPVRRHRKTYDRCASALHHEGMPGLVHRCAVGDAPVDAHLFGGLGVRLGHGVSTVTAGEISARYVTPKPLGTPPLPREQWPSRQVLSKWAGGRSEQPARDEGVDACTATEDHSGAPLNDPTDDEIEALSGRSQRLHGARSTSTSGRSTNWTSRTHGTAARAMATRSRCRTSCIAILSTP